jgi:tetratricopeptide (TPR) repeat protein
MAKRVLSLFASAGLLVLLSGTARTEWLQPDPSYREAQLVLRLAIRDTVGHAEDPGRLDSVGVALLRLARLDDAERVFRKSLALLPGDDAAEAGLGKIALFNDRLAEAESLLAAVADPDPLVLADLLAARVRRGEYAAAAAMAKQEQQGRVPMLEAMAEQPVYQLTGKSEIKHNWARAYPVPLVRVKLNGNSVLMAVDLGAGDLLIDAGASRRYKVGKVTGQRLEFWNGTRLSVQNAMVQRLEIGGMKIERLPAGVLSLRKWGMEVNPQSEPPAGVIGLNLLRRFTPTLDYERQRLELKPLDATLAPSPGAPRVPFQIWGENELMVFGSLAASRRMALILQTGVPGCGVGAPAEVFDEIGVKAGAISRLVKGAGTWLQGRPWAAVTVPTVTVGPVVKDKVPGWHGALDSAELWRHGVRRDALLSNEFFRGRRLTIDWKAHELVFDESE